MKHFKDLEDIYRGSPLVICGNAPSLLDVPVELFEKYPTMACNSVYARGYFKDNTPDIYTIEGLGHLKTDEEREARMPYIQKVADAGGFSLVNRRMSAYFSHLPSIYYIDYVDKICDQFVSFQFEPFKHYGTGHCVTFCLLQFAYYLTSGAVLMVGMDHKFVDSKWHFFPDEDVPEFSTMPEQQYATFRQRVDPMFREAAEVYRVTDRVLLNLTPESDASMFEKDKLENWI